RPCGASRSRRDCTSPAPWRPVECRSWQNDPSPSSQGGTPMSSSDTGALVRLTVRVADAGTEVFVSDPQLRVVGSGLGGYSGAHPPGIYQVRLRVGFATRDDVVLLPVGQKEVLKTYPPLALAGPVPLADSTAAA